VRPTCRWGCAGAPNLDTFLSLRQFGRIIPAISVTTLDRCPTATNTSCCAELAGFLSDSTRRATAVCNLVATAKKQQFGGWNFDQEMMNCASNTTTQAQFTEGWVRFLSELSIAMQAADPTAAISVDICGW
jgi:hypothetical protein